VAITFLYSAVAGISFSPLEHSVRGRGLTLPRSPHDWNFDSIPDHHLIACCYWEYARESAFLKQFKSRCVEANRNPQPLSQAFDLVGKDARTVLSIGTVAAAPNPATAGAPGLAAANPATPEEAGLTAANPVTAEKAGSFPPLNLNSPLSTFSHRQFPCRLAISFRSREGNRQIP
jgi:hypothetical protein